MPRRRRKLRIRFKKKFPFVQFGSSPVAHVKKMRSTIARLVTSADATIRIAERGDCKDAVSAYGDTTYLYGELHAHQYSTGKGLSSVTRHMKRVNTTPIARKVVAARKAVEACLVRR